MLWREVKQIQVKRSEGQRVLIIYLLIHSFVVMKGLFEAMHSASSETDDRVSRSLTWGRAFQKKLQVQRPCGMARLISACWETGRGCRARMVGAEAGEVTGPGGGGPCSPWYGFTGEIWVRQEVIEGLEQEKEVPWQAFSESTVAAVY